MPSYECTACKLTFANPYHLKRHISEKHRNRVTAGDDHDSGTSKMSYQEDPDLWTDYDSGTSKIPYQEDPNLWTDDDDGTSKIPYQEDPNLWTDDVVDNDDKDKMVSKFSWLLTEYI